MIFRMVLVFGLLWIPINGVIAQTDGSRLSGEKLLSQEALVLVEIPNVESFVKKGKTAFYDTYYSVLHQQGMLRQLDFLPLQQALSERVEEQHWLCNTIDSFASKENETIQELNELAGLFKRQSFKLDAEDEERLVELMASLFPGSFCWGVEPSDGIIEFVFAFEYDPAVFDWKKEMMLAASRGDDDAEPVISVDQVDIFALPVGGIHFFCVENIVFGTSSTDEQCCVRLAQRVLKHNTETKNLATSRHYQRVKSELAWHDDPDSCFFYIRIQELNKFEIPEDVHREAGQREKKMPGYYIEKYRATGWSEYGGGFVKIGKGGAINYRTMFPLKLPVRAGVETLLRISKNGLESDRDYYVPESGVSVVWGIAPESKADWKTIPNLSWPSSVDQLEREGKRNDQSFRFKDDRSDWWELLDPEEAQSHAYYSNPGNRMISRMLFDSHVMSYTNFLEKIDRSKPVDLRPVRLDQVFNDISPDEHVFAFQYSNKSTLYQGTHSPLSPLSRFVGRCNANNPNSLGWAMIVGDFAFALDSRLAKQIIPEENPALVNLCAAIASNFYETSGFARAWESNHEVPVKLNSFYMVSELRDSIVCRGVLKDHNADVAQNK